MPTRRALIIAGVLSLFLALVILFPARVAFNWFAPPGISLGGIVAATAAGSDPRLGRAMLIHYLKQHAQKNRPRVSTATRLRFMRVRKRQIIIVNHDK
ncbi:MAG: hypothetical protein IID59_02735 [Proteobacteria bacterium]|nr:hypothetical protein [Pseudomonadota bacterium]